MKILRHVLESIVSHARRTRPMECCGVLLAEGPPSAVVTRALPAKNAAKNPRTGYVLSPKEHIRAVKMESAGVARIAGYYHSHPHGGCSPSRRDRRQALPDVNYLIVGLNDGRASYALWRLEGDRFTVESVEVAE